MEPRISIITLCVEDMHRSYNFYKNGLGFTTPQSIDAPIYFFETFGTRLAIYPLKEMAKEFPDNRSLKRGDFAGFTLAHNTQTKADVDTVINTAISAGAKLVKRPQDVFWGGYSGYFEDPDGYLWEVAYADSWIFNDDGSLNLDNTAQCH